MVERAISAASKQEERGVSHGKPSVSLWPWSPWSLFTRSLRVPEWLLVYLFLQLHFLRLNQIFGFIMEKFTFIIFRTIAYVPASELPRNEKKPFLYFLCLLHFLKEKKKKITIPKKTALCDVVWGTASLLGIDSNLFFFSVSKQKGTHKASGFVTKQKPRYFSRRL